MSLDIGADEDIPKGPFNPKEELEEFNQRWTKNKSSSAGLSSFDMHHILGEGSFGKVVLIKNKNKNEFYALKILDKEKIVKSKQINHTIGEKKILYAMKYTFCIRLFAHFQDNSNLYLVMDFAEGGDLYEVFVRFRKFNEQMSKFYSSQLFLAIEYLQMMDCMHRDLKPENVLVDGEGYLKVTDFGFAKRSVNRAWTFCGTPEYIAPEIIQNKGYNLSVDWWSWGVMVYEMVNGSTPFRGKTHKVIFENIVSGRVPFPRSFTEPLKDLLRNVIQKDITKRYGNLKNGSRDIRNHKWFSDCNFDHIYLRKVKPPYQPSKKSPLDVRNPKKLAIKIAKSDKYPDLFIDF